MLKELPIYLLDEYILIDESACYYIRNNISIDIKKQRQAAYDRYLEEGKIKSALDFDNYFSPYLTLDILFEKDRTKANALIKKTLIQIGERWVQRLKSLFPEHDYTLIVFLHFEDSEWYLDFYNGTVDIEKIDSSGRCRNVVYLNR